MLTWITQRVSAAYRRMHEREARVFIAKTPIRTMTGTYLQLYTYLETRFADTVVLTFAEIEDVLGFALPPQAHQRPEWWTAAPVSGDGLNYADSWILASRTALPNMRSRSVSFPRA